MNMNDKALKRLARKTYNILRGTYYGVCDTNVLRNELIKELLLELMDASDMDEEKEWFEKYGLEFTEEVRPLTENMAKETIKYMSTKNVLNLYGFTMTKSAYDRMRKTVHHVEDDPDSLKYTPANWTTNFRCKQIPMIMKKYIKTALRHLRKDNDGIMDKKHLVEWLTERTQDRELSKEVVNWLGQNVVLDLYDMLVTRQAYKKMLRIVELTHEVMYNEEHYIKHLPRQWKHL